MFKRVLFCIPPFPNRYGLPTHPHTGIGYLAQILNNNGIQTEVVDFRLGRGYEMLEEKIKDFKPDLIGITMMTYYHNLAYEIVRYLKTLGIPIIIGGPHVSTLKEQALLESGADFGFKMEAELALLDFCNDKPLETIPGLIYRKGNEIKQNDPQFISDLNNIPFPKYEGIELTGYTRKRIAIITSRGCPCQCTFCPIATVMGRKYRFRTAENVFSELEYWYRLGYRDFDFQDDNFTIDKNRVYALFDLIKNVGFKDLFMQCGNGIRADLATHELLTRMKQAGFKSVAFGVESFNAEVLKTVKKGESIAEIENAVKIAVEVGLEISLFFIVGLPGETLKTFQESIDFSLKYPVTTATFYNLIPFPGTELYEWVKNNNYFLTQPKDYLNTVAHLEFIPVFETPEFSSKDRKKALLMGSKINILIKRRDMERKLGNSIFAVFLSWLLYETFLNKLIFYLIKTKWIKRSINFILLKLRLRLNL